MNEWTILHAANDCLTVLWYYKYNSRRLENYYLHKYLHGEYIMKYIILGLIRPNSFPNLRYKQTRLLNSGSGSLIYALAV